jgi:O-antigen ligase
MFYLFLSFNVVIAFLNGVNPFDWVREFLLFSLILYYFPIREYFKDKKSLFTLLFLFACAILVLDFFQFYTYYKMIKNVIYAYQLGRSAKINQQIFSAAVISGITLFFYLSNKKAKFLSLIVVIFSTGALISTFSRAFWLATMAMVLVLCVFLNYKQVLQFFLIVLFSTGLLLISINIFMPTQANFVQKYITKRFSSAGQGTKDISVRFRFYEAREVTKMIKESPIWGHGLRKKFRFYDNIAEATTESFFVHNGYLNITYKTGIPMAFILYLSLLLYTINGLTTAWKLGKISNKVRKILFDKDLFRTIKFYQALAICGTLSLGMLFITNFATSSFFFRDGLMVTAFSIAFIGIAESKLKNIRLNLM